MMNLDIQNDDYKDNFKILLYKQKGQTNFSLEERIIIFVLILGITYQISNFLNKSVRTNIYWTHISICLKYLFEKWC